MEVSVSAGIAAGNPRELPAVMVDADRALYRAKGGGGTRVGRSLLG
jgi:PleD family two-component response regulator